MSNSIQKEAQAFTKLKEKVLPTARRKTKISPVRWAGKALLKRRSPEVYAKALTAIDNADAILRNTISKQRVNLAEMKKYAKGLSVTGFSIAANKFVREQKLINAITVKLDTVFQKIADEKGVKGGAGEARINLAINMDIGKRPGFFSKEPEADLTNEKDYIDEQLGKIGELYLGLCKEALFGGRYWKTRTQSGKDFARKFDYVLAKFKVISDKNVRIAERLDELHDIGDPGEYLKIAKTIDNMTEVLSEGTMATAFEIFKVAPPVVSEPKPAPQAPPENLPLEPKDVKTVFETKQSERPRIEKIKQPTVPPPPMAPTKIIDTPKVEKPVTTPPPKAELPKPEVREKGGESELEKQLGVKPAMEHFKFLKKLAKKVENGADETEVAQYILRYAEKIDGLDTEYSLKLTAIAEGMIDE